MSKRHRWSEEEKLYLKEIVLDRSYKEIASLMKDKFNYNFEVMQIQAAIKRYGLSTGRSGHFVKGGDPWNKGTKGLSKPNKTSFKKGNIPMCLLPVGTERVYKGEGYVKVKVAEPNKWELKHKLIYEKYYGKVEEGDAIIFLDGNKANFNIDNLYKVSRHQLLLMNKNKLIYENAELTKLGVEVTSLIIRTIEATKKVNNE